MESCAAGNICKYCLCECGPAELDNVWVQDWKRTKQRQPVRKKKNTSNKVQTYSL